MTPESQIDPETASSGPVSAPEAPESLEKRILALDWRDLQLWCIAAVLVSVLAAGFLLLLMPQLLWDVTADMSRQANMPQLFFGLLVLLVLSNLYLFSQRLQLVRTRRELVHQLQIAERTARTDALTGVYNRRWLDETLLREMSRAERNKGHFTIMMADVNDFKIINTRVGHVEGDRILVEVARLLQRNFRASDSVVRYGGDEFIALMPDTDLAQARVAVERLQRFVDLRNARHDSAITLSLSCGLATFLPGMSMDALMEAADEDMYAQKPRRSDRSGPNLRAPL
ncbi:MAG TPA: GGDEF domain-containing protein [Terriglobales bacterium]|nr:GGDEF domain-containing protein [Terriglobales bacterium]